MTKGDRTSSCSRKKASTPQPRTPTRPTPAITNPATRIPELAPWDVGCATPATAIIKAPRPITPTEVVSHVGSLGPRRFGRVGLSSPARGGIRSARAIRSYESIYDARSCRELQEERGSGPRREKLTSHPCPFGPSFLDHHYGCVWLSLPAGNTQRSPRNAVCQSRWTASLRHTLGTRRSM